VPVILEQDFAMFHKLKLRHWRSCCKEL